MMYWGSTGWGAEHWVAMTLVTLLGWAALIALAVWAVRRSRGDRGRGPADHAQELLAERFARGEIDVEAFLRSREVLDRPGG